MKFMLFNTLPAALAYKAPDDALSPSLQKEPLYLCEEEKAARDVYDHVGSLYGINPFLHIYASERSNFETMEALVVSMGIIADDEVIRTEPGIFIDPKLQSPYNEFIPQGEVSVTEALKVGAYMKQHGITGQ